MPWRCGLCRSARFHVAHHVLSPPPLSTTLLALSYRRAAGRPIFLSCPQPLRVCAAARLKTRRAPARFNSTAYSFLLALYHYHSMAISRHAVLPASITTACACPPCDIAHSCAFPSRLPSFSSSYLFAVPATFRMAPFTFLPPAAALLLPVVVGWWAWTCPCLFCKHFFCCDDMTLLNHRRLVGWDMNESFGVTGGQAKENKQAGARASSWNGYICSRYRSTCILHKQRRAAPLAA